MTPRDYEPPGFVAANSSTVRYACEVTPAKYRLGFVATEFHAAKVRFQSTLMDTVTATPASQETSTHQEEITSQASEDIVPATPEHQGAAPVMSSVQENAAKITALSSFPPENSDACAEQVAMNQPSQEFQSTSVADSHQFVVPHPVTKSATGIPRNDKDNVTVVLNDVNASAKSKKRTFKTTGQGDVKNQPNLKKKKLAKKEPGKATSKKIQKARPARKVEENKENINNTTAYVADGTGSVTTGMKDAEGGMTASTLTSTKLRKKETRARERDDSKNRGTEDQDIEKGGVSCSVDSEVNEELHNPELLHEQKKQGQRKSSVTQATIKIMDVSSSTASVMAKEVSCCCNSSQEFGLMIRCENCMTWQHSVCYGILDGSSEFIEQHCCVQCASVDGPHQCTDKALFKKNEDARKALCTFRQALQLCHQLPTITRIILQNELELSENVADLLLNELKDKNIIRGSGPRSTIFIVNSENLKLWLTHIFGHVSCSSRR